VGYIRRIKYGQQILQLMTDTALTIFLCKPAGLEERNLALGVEVLLVADEDDDDVWTGQ